MKQSHLKRDVDGRLRDAATSACRKRGANAGTVLDVIETLHEHDLLDNSLTRQNFRKRLCRIRGHWKDKYCSVINLPCDSGDDLEAPTLHFGQPFQQSKRFFKNVVEVHRTLYIGSESSDTM